MGTLGRALQGGDVEVEVRFVRAVTGIPRGTSEACTKGSFTGADGRTYRFLGCDTVVINPSS